MSAQSERLHFASVRLSGGKGAGVYVLVADVRLAVEALRRLNPGHEGSLRQLAEALGRVEAQQR